MSILGPDGQVFDSGGDKAVIPVAAGASLQLKVDKDGTVLETPGAFLVFDPGEWIIVPMAIWQATLRKLLIASSGGGLEEPARNRAERRRRARDRRN